MKDFNFFDQLAVGSKKKTSSLTYVISVILLLFLALGSISYYYLIELRELRNEKMVLSEKANDDTHQQEYNEVLELTERIQMAEIEKVDLERIHGQLINSRRINSILIKEISMAKPDAIALKSINFTPLGINVEGSSISQDLIASFEYNLRGNVRFDGPYIPMIEKVTEGNYYNFTLSFTFKESIEIEEEGDIANGEG